MTQRMRMRKRMPTLRKPSDIGWIAVALTIGVGGGAFATATSGADDDPPATSGPPPAFAIAAITDPALTSNDPSDGAAATAFAEATGVSGDATTPQVWSVGGRSVLGYSADDGRFCFEFRELTGGCLRAGTIDDQQPLGVTLDHGPAAFRVYGLALDGVTAVAVHIDGAEHQAELAHNAFAFSDDALGATTATSMELVATMSDGTTRTQTVPISSLDPP
jgi:hypothetical protein